MIRRPPDTTWDFGSALELFDSDWTGPGTPAPLSPSRKDRALETSLADRTLGNEAPRLGSFNKLFEQLGIDLNAPLLPSVPAEPSDPIPDDPITSDDAFYSPPDDNVDPIDDKDICKNDTSRTSKEVGHGSAKSDSDDVLAGMSKKQRRSARKQAEKARKAEHAKQEDSDDKHKKRGETQARLDQAAQIQEKASSVLKHGVARSNVGAKIRPATPVDVMPAETQITRPLAVQPIIQRQHTDIPTRIQPQRLIPRFNSYNESAQYPVVSPYANVHYNGGNGPALLDINAIPSTPNRLHALSNLSSSLSTQYTTVGAQIPYHRQLPHGFVTPERGRPYPHTPSTIPMVKSQFPFSADSPGVPPVLIPKRQPRKAALRSREDRDYDFLKKLIDQFPEDKKWLVSPMRLSSDKLSPTGIHVFVDASNILIGFKEVMRRSGGSFRDMSFDSLALLLERRRPVAKRVYAGSTRLSAPIASVEKFNDLAGAVGYEKNIYEQVYKVKEQTESQKFFKDVDRVGWAKATQLRSGSGSDSETGATSSSPPPPLKWVEQGVDESLHLKMCQSIIDADIPSTMVLATGDGAVAEYSDGFLAHVERALKKGWKVELVSWKQQTSSGYKNRKFREKWHDQFKIIELDEFLECMVDV